MFINMYKLRRKVRNDQNLPHESQDFTNYLKKKSNFTYTETTLQKQYFLNNFYFLL